MSTKPLTPTQLAYAVYLHSYLQANDNLPTFVQAAKDFSVSPNAVNCIYKMLVNKGVIERGGKLLDMFRINDELLACSSSYGLCE